MTLLKPVTIDFDLIEQAMRDLSRENSDYYLHKPSGHVMVLSRKLIRFMAQDADIDREELPAWEEQMVPTAREIIVMGSPEYVRIPEAFGRPQHRWMMKFSGTVKAPKIRQKLISALRGRGACKRFREILKDAGDEQTRWSSFRARCCKDEIELWLATIGILAVEQRPLRSTTK